MKKVVPPKKSSKKPSAKRAPRGLRPVLPMVQPPAGDTGSSAAQRSQPIESLVIGEFETTPDYRLHGATTATMLVQSFSPLSGAFPVAHGIEKAADELHVLSCFAISDDGREVDAEIIRNVADGIQSRLRVMAEIARRMHRAGDEPHVQKERA